MPSPPGPICSPTSQSEEQTRVGTPLNSSCWIEQPAVSTPPSSLCTLLSEVNSVHLLQPWVPRHPACLPLGKLRPQESLLSPSSVVNLSFSTASFYWLFKDRLEFSEEVWVHSWIDRKVQSLPISAPDRPPPPSTSPPEWDVCCGQWTCTDKAHTSC